MLTLLHIDVPDSLVSRTRVCRQSLDWNNRYYVIFTLIVSKLITKGSKCCGGTCLGSVMLGFSVSERKSDERSVSIRNNEKTGTSGKLMNETAALVYTVVVQITL